MEALQITKYLSEAYPKDAWSEERFVLWADAIGDLDFPSTQSAARQWVLTEKWPPTVAEIRDLTRSFASDYQPRALQLCPPWESTEPPITEEQRAENVKKIQAMTAELAAKKSVEAYSERKGKG